MRTLPSAISRTAEERVFDHLAHHSHLSSRCSGPAKSRWSGCQPRSCRRARERLPERPSARRTANARRKPAARAWVGLAGDGSSRLPPCGGARASADRVRRCSWRDASPCACQDARSHRTPLRWLRSRSDPVTALSPVSAGCGSGGRRGVLGLVRHELSPLAPEAERLQDRGEILARAADQRHQLGHHAEAAVAGRAGGCRRAASTGRQATRARIRSASRSSMSMRTARVPATWKPAARQ